MCFERSNVHILHNRYADKIQISKIEKLWCNRIFITQCSLVASPFPSKKIAMVSPYPLTFFTIRSCSILNYTTLHWPRTLPMTQSSFATSLCKRPTLYQNALYTNTITMCSKPWFFFFAEKYEEFWEIRGRVLFFKKTTLKNVWFLKNFEKKTRQNMKYLAFATPPLPLSRFIYKVWTVKLE